MLNDFEKQIAKDETKASLYRSLKYTRHQENGITIEEIANCVKAVFDEAEVKALVKEL